MPPLRQTVRSLRRQPGWALAAVATLAPALGVLTALSAYLSGLWWPVVEAPFPDRVVNVWAASVEEPRALTAYADYQALAAPTPQRRELLERVVAWTPLGAAVTTGPGATYSWATAVSGGYFEFWGGRPHLGRLLGPADDTAAAPAVVVLSHGFWQQTFGGDSAILGRVLRVNGHDVTVVGVTTASFRGHGNVTGLYVPLTQTDRLTGLPRQADPSAHYLMLAGRRSAQAGLDAVNGQLAALARHLDVSAPRPDGVARSFQAVSASHHDPGFGPDTALRAATALTGVAALFLLLAAATLTNLLLARASARRAEWAVQAALGAGRRQLVSTLLAESLVVCGVSALLGLGLAALFLRRVENLVATTGGGLGGFTDSATAVSLNGTAWAVGGLAAFAAAGAAAALAGREVLRSALHTAAPPARTGRLRRALVVGQLALSVVLLVAGTLLVRSLRAVHNADLGFNPAPLVTATLFVPRGLTPPDRIFELARQQAAEVPGVAAASLVHVTPLAGWYRPTRVQRTDSAAEPIEVGHNLVGPGFLTAVGLPLLAGRELGTEDHAHSPPAVMINRALARRLFGEENPLGHQLTVAVPAKAGEPAGPFEVVGVAADSRFEIPTEPPAPRVYLAASQRGHTRMTVLARAAPGFDPGALHLTLAQRLERVHPDLARLESGLVVEQRERLLRPLRLNAEVASLLAGLGLGVAGVGLYGLLSFTIARRRRDLAIRQALGATRGDVHRLVLATGLRWTLLGTGLGVTAALAGARLLQSLLYGVGPLDPVAFLAAPGLLALLAAPACWIPAHRAARQDPAAELKSPAA